VVPAAKGKAFNVLDSSLEVYGHLRMHLKRSRQALASSK